MGRPERLVVLDLLRRISASPLGARLILAGSSGVYGASATLPALTEDVDVVVDADWAAAEEPMLMAEMRRLGFEHQPGTCTFLSPGGLSVDLVGYSRRDVVDRIGGGAAVPIMIFADLSRLLAAAGATVELPTGGRALSVPALTAAKLMTVRVEKGSKDKLQALLLIAENAGDPSFLEELRNLLEAFEPDRVEDALADAQVACLTVSGDALLAEPEARGYAEMTRAADRGLTVLQELLAQPPEKP